MSDSNKVEKILEDLKSMSLIEASNLIARILCLIMQLIKIS
jgi:hypothetical protein